MSWLKTCARSKNSPPRSQVLKCVPDKAKHREIGWFWNCACVETHRRSDQIDGRHPLLSISWDYWRAPLLLQKWHLVPRSHALWAMRFETAFWGIKHALSVHIDCKRTLSGPARALFKGTKNFGVPIVGSWRSQTTFTKANFAVANCKAQN